MIRVFYGIWVTYLYGMNNGLYLKDGNIEISDESIAYWSEKWNCSPQDIKDAIYRIGNNYNILILYLTMNRRINQQD